MLQILHPTVERSHGEGWQKCEAERPEIERLLEQHVRLSKVRRLLHRRGVVVPYSTLHRFAVSELGFGRGVPTIPVSDGKPGEEVHIDTGWMTRLEPDEHGQRRWFRACIFTPHVSRYRFVYPCFAESTETAIEACEAAWEFYGDVFGVVVVCRLRSRRNVLKRGPRVAGPIAATRLRSGSVTLVARVLAPALSRRSPAR